MTNVKYVYTIIEKEGSDKNHWVKIGVAFVNKDQSLNLRLDALPLNGTLHVRDPQPFKKPEENGAEAAEA